MEWFSDLNDEKNCLAFSFADHKILYTTTMMMVLVILNLSP
jgi:hypothetical protein